jgi:hypothetical protein
MFKKIIALFIIFAFQTGIIYAQTCIDGVSPGSASFTHQGGSVDINYELIKRMHQHTGYHKCHLVIGNR